MRLNLQWLLRHAGAITLTCLPNWNMMINNDCGGPFHDIHEFDYWIQIIRLIHDIHEFDYWIQIIRLIPRLITLR